MKSLLDSWSKEEEASVWQEAIFLFDSSAMLNFYELSNTTRVDIYTTIFPLLKQRLWITNQTEYEFLKNKEKIANRPRDLYQDIKDNHYLSKHIGTFLKQFDQLKERTSKESRHPYFTQTKFTDVHNVLEELGKRLEALEENLDTEIGQRLLEHNATIKEDPLLSFFSVTSPYSYQQLMEIAKEGEFRYRHEIPPGYADEKGKSGIDKFGDLIIWKQALDLARQVKKPLILIIDDLKPDWCVVDKKDKRKIVRPRRELIKEMRDDGGVAFWSYDSSQFVYKAKEILKSGVNDQVIKEVSGIASRWHSQVEEAVYEWAKRRFRADETLWAEDFWHKDTGADIIQTVDGVPFSIQVKSYGERGRMKEIAMDLQDILNIRDGDFVFELNVVVFVGETKKMALAVKGLMSDALEGFQLYAGYVNDSGHFIELSNDNS